MRAYGKTHYARNRDYYLRKAARRRTQEDASELAFVLAYLKQHPCVDCGERDITVLQFDHVDPATKDDDVSALIRRRVGRDRILREIQKCEVRCGNCHRRRTFRQRQSGEIREDAAPYAYALLPTIALGPLAQLDRARTF